MHNYLDLSKFETAPVAEIAEGDYLLNLGQVLEKEELDTHYNLIIDRFNKKQVVKFKKDIVLVTI